MSFFEIGCEFDFLECNGPTISNLITCSISIDTVLRYGDIGKYTDENQKENSSQDNDLVSGERYCRNIQKSCRSNQNSLWDLIRTIESTKPFNMQRTIKKAQSLSNAFQISKASPFLSKSSQTLSEITLTRVQLSQ